ncbi:MEDS domain-containing protein [Micromonospora psammae]|uniref:MEDS domain-containing protein n=1 Tax=Micromonospora sp. CPCC 205556 TaxID=3122398 RepID=UPI002FEEEF50
MTSGSTSPRHVCWAYDDRAAFTARARDFLLAGLAAGERVRHTSTEPPEAVAARWQDVPRLREALRTGAAEIVPVSDAYGHGLVDAEAQVAGYVAATAAALDDGHAGLRVVADATSLVRTPAQRAAFARYEHLVDRFLRTHPMTAACAYDRGLLGDRAVEELACLHPAADPDVVLFHLYGGDPGELVLTGELDASNEDGFATALERVHVDQGELVVRADELRFIDYRALTHLHRHAARRDATVVLRTSLAPAARLVALLGLSRIRIETPR